MRLRPGAIVAIGSLVVSSVLAGCTSTAEPRVEKTASGDSPGFTGPYATDFERAYRNAETDRVRRILSDGVITPEEFTETRANIESCLKDNDYYIEWDERGGFEVGAIAGKHSADGDGFHEKMDPILRACEGANDGEITFLYQETTRNPKNVDERPAIVKCLIDNKLVPKGYTVRDYKRDDDNSTLPFPDFEKTAVACRDDPFGLWAARP